MRESVGIEYIVIHEMMHYFEHGHGPKFVVLMGQNLPDWHERKARLEEISLSKEDWDLVAISKWNGRFG